MEPAKKLHPAITAIIIIVLVGIAATAVIIINQPKDTKTDTTSTTTTSDVPAETTDASTTSSYKDGTYTATGSYSSPGGRESIDLVVVIKGGVITETSMVTNAKDGDAKEYQAKFAGAYKNLVIGKSVDKVSLSRVAGSSLTSNGFNDALDQIKSDAKA